MLYSRLGIEHFHMRYPIFAVADKIDAEEKRKTVLERGVYTLWS
jgi:hypothetical protein